jgi:hypothetical protein
MAWDALVMGLNDKCVGTKVKLVIRNIEDLHEIWSTLDVCYELPENTSRRYCQLQAARGFLTIWPEEIYIPSCGPPSWGTKALVFSRYSSCGQYGRMHGMRPRTGSKGLWIDPIGSSVQLSLSMRSLWSK